MIPKVKVCGLSTRASFEAVVGVDMIGLNFWPRSKRYFALDWSDQFGVGVERVGLFVDPSEDEVRAALDRVPLDRLQFHGDESPDFCRSFSMPFMKAFRLRDEAVLATIPDYLDGPDSLFLVDAWVPGEVGGTGRAARRDLALKAAQIPGRMLLAGGLTPETVAEAVRAVRPWGVDVAGGVERAPGDKDPELVRRFVTAARESE